MAWLKSDAQAIKHTERMEKWSVKKKKNTSGTFLYVTAKRLDFCVCDEEMKFVDNYAESINGEAWSSGGLTRLAGNPLGC